MATVLELDSAQKSITVIEDHPLIATAMRDAINRYSRSALVQLCGSLATALPVLHSIKPRLVILDICLPDARGPGVIASVREAAPDAYLVLWSGNEEAARDIPEVRSGQVPFLSKSLAQKEINRSLRAVLRRCGLLDALGQVADVSASQADPCQLLSPKQRQILCLLATGRSNQEIATTLNVSTDTVKTHLSGIFGKLNVKNRTQAVLWYQLNLGTDSQSG